MRCKIPEISWHNRDPVLSVDIQPNKEKSSVYRLASGGTDSHVLIWSLSFTETGEINLDVAADLTRHQRAVNVVKWSPSGELLASGDDESFVFIWKQKGESENVMLDADNENDKETWITMKVLRGHMEDVYDLSWAPNSQFLVSGSVDNTAIIWDVFKGKSVSILKDHKGFVQGVTWDPKNQYIATLSTDRILRVFDIQTKKIVQRTSKSILPVSKENELYGKKVRLYHDDTLQTFFRRLCFSPDGKFLFTPAGVTDYEGVTNILHTSYVYSRFTLKNPSVMLPSPDQYTVAIKCCPVLFKLRNKADAESAVFPLPYRMVFAIATKSSVYLYDTQQKVPFGMISNIHYTRLTDITWSNDGRIMIVSSTDGFCSVITFDDGELGDEYDDLTILKPAILTSNKKNKSKPKENFNTNKKHELENTELKNGADDGNSFKFSLDKISNELIIDKDIISSDEKFESPKKKMRVATPIVIRRHPRAPSISKTSSDDRKASYLTPNKDNNKNAKPIAIRRTPRALIPSTVEKTAIGEEALDAWPVKISSLESEVDELRRDLRKTTDIPITINLKKSDQETSKIETSNDCTDDIRLVYEETADEITNPDFSLKETNAQIIEENEASQCSQQTEVIRLKYDEKIHDKPKELSSHVNENGSFNKKPSKELSGISDTKKTKRVELKTISTPKSKKSLLEEK